MRLKNQAAIVTGAARGIGRAVALRLAREGYAVIVDDIDATGGEATVQEAQRAGGRALFVRADVSRDDEVRRMVATATEAFGAPTVLINSAIAPLSAIVGNQVGPNIDVVLQGAWQCIQGVLPGMRAAGRGSIINISSVNALMGFGKEHIYSGVKAALIGLSRSLCNELGADGIRINCICPGTVLTEIWHDCVRQDPGIVDRLARLYPLRRLGQPEDIANAALFLASDESSFITGSALVVDGGVTAANLGFGGLSSRPPASGADTPTDNLPKTPGESA